VEEVNIAPIMHSGTIDLIIPCIGLPLHNISKGADEKTIFLNIKTYNTNHEIEN
jgi:hypothetical protein